MEPNAGTEFRPKANALKIVIDAFKRAPVPNPDGTTGINLHIDAGSDSIMNPVNNRRWGSLSRAGSVPYQQFIIPCTGGPPCTYNYTDLDNIKAIRFNPTRRASIFHYALFANQYGFPDPGSLDSSGLSRDIPAADFIVTLGQTGPGVVRGGTVFEQAGTFMHEFGHNLGLRHGGDEDLPQRKPNHLSIMNYRFQFRGLIKANGGREFDYSRRTLPPLDENALNESIGISDPDNHRTIWGSTGGPMFTPCTSQLPSPRIDWNCNSMLNAGPVAISINADVPRDILRGFTEWPALVFDGGGRIGTGASRGEISVPANNLSEASVNELRNAAPPDILQQEACSIEENVTFTPETGGQAPLTVTFDASASTAPCGTIVSYSWDFGDNTTGSGPTVMHTYTSPGTYIAKLTMIDNSGNTNLVQLDHVVNIPCSFSLSQTFRSFTSSGGQGDTAVTSLAGCNWTVMSNNSWIVVVSGETGSGSDVVSFEVRENLRLGSRQGTITIAGQTFTITQSGNCSFSISPQLQSFISSGGTGSVNVTLSNNCDWTAVSNNSWITITSSNSGVGSGTVTYSVAANPGPTRIGTMTIAGKTFTVKQKPGV